MDYLALAQHCAPKLDSALVVRLVRRESSFNPFAIGLDGRQSLTPQPQSFDEAVEVAERLIQQGISFSAGVGQLHITNIRRFGLTWRQVFHACTNLSYAQTIFLYYHGQALTAGLQGDDAVFAALRGYNSGNINAAISNNYAAAILARPTSIQASISAPRRHVNAAAPAFSSNAQARADESKEFFEE